MKYPRHTILIGCLFVTGLLAAEDTIPAGSWTIKESEVSYSINHAMKTATGTSRQARGKARCAATCEVLIGIPVSSFDSGDSNRDLHMLEATKGASFPVAMVRTKFKAVAGKIKTDFSIEFAGKTATVQGVDLTISSKGGGTLQADGQFVLKLSQFSIVRPSLLGFSVDDEVPVTIHSTWQSGK